jgi:hypothetical protein
MSESVRLSKQAALRLLAVSRQAERSIDAVLHRSQSVWSALREYYGAERRKLVTAAIAELGCEGPTRVKMDPRWMAAKARSRLRLLVDCLANKWREAWSVPPDERCFLAGGLIGLLSVLECVQQPPHEDLVQLRLHLTSAVALLENKLWGVRETRRIYDVEYFAPPPWDRLSSISELIP